MSEYVKSGVNIDKGMESVNRIKKLVKETFNINVVSDIGAFGAMYNGDFSNYKNPILVSSADGVGTKLVIAQKMNYFDHVGEDIVNHSVDDILAVGAKPLYFLDYIGCGKIDPNIIERIIASMTKACKENSMSLIGGELAEMSIVYNYEHYDIVGFITGIAEKENIITGGEIKEGDILIGLNSSGFHTNGYSLVRKIIEDNNIKYDDKFDFSNEEIYKLLLKPHKSYFNSVYTLIEKQLINGIAHITGGGFYDNIKRILPYNTNAIIDSSTWETPEIMKKIVELGKIEFEESYRVFNMGIGMVLIINKNNLKNIENELNSKNEKYTIIGEIIKGNGSVIVK